MTSILGTAPIQMAVIARTPEPLAASRRVRSDPLLCWALVEHRDGSISMEGFVRDEEWLEEPGGAELPEALRGAVPQGRPVFVARIITSFPNMRGASDGSCRRS